MTTTDISRGDSPQASGAPAPDHPGPPYPPEHVRWRGEDIGHAPVRAPTRGTERLGAAFRAQVALRAPGVVVIPAPAAASKDEPSDLPAPGLSQTPATETSGIRDVAAVTLDKARDHLLRLQDPHGWWIGELETIAYHGGRRGRAAPALPRHPDRGRAG